MFTGKQEETARHSTNKKRRLHGKRPALPTRGNLFSQRLCDKEDKMTAELRHSDDAQHLSGDRRGRRIRVLHRSVFGRQWRRELDPVQHFLKVESQPLSQFRSFSLCHVQGTKENIKGCYSLLLLIFSA